MKKTCEELLLADFEEWLNEEAARQPALCAGSPARLVDQMMLFTHLHQLSRLIHIYKEGRQNV